MEKDYFHCFVNKGRCALLIGEVKYNLFFKKTVEDSLDGKF